MPCSHNARTLLEASPLFDSAGATSPHPEVVVLRVLAPVVEPAMQLLRQVWQAWRSELWQLPAATPRIWATWRPISLRSPRRGANL